MSAKIKKGMFYCPECKKVYENYSGGSSNYKIKIKTDYYEDFPSLGKERMICGRCRGKQLRMIDLVSMMEFSKNNLSVFIGGLYGMSNRMICQKVKKREYRDIYGRYLDEEDLKMTGIIKYKNNY